MCHPPQTPRHLFEASTSDAPKFATGGLGGAARSPQSFLHASAAARAGAGVLLLGSSGAGKSNLLLRLIDRGFDLIADDQVEMDGLIARAPPAIAGILEVRGLGLVRLPHVAAQLVLAVRLGAGERLPAPARLPDLDLPLISLDASAASAPQRIALALDCLQGRIAMVAGAFT